MMTIISSVAFADEWEHQTGAKLVKLLQYDMIPEVWGCGEQRITLRDALIRFYEYRRYRPAWVNAHGMLPEGDAVLATLRHAADQGLHSYDDNHRILEELFNNRVDVPSAGSAETDERRLQLDLILTGMILRYAFDVTEGRTHSSISRFGDMPESPPRQDMAVALAAMLDSGRLASFLGRLGPRHTAYRALQKSLLAYRRMKASGGWPVINEGPTLKFGDSGIRVAILRYRLAVSGDADVVSGGMDDHFDDALAMAVMHFQRRHGLNVDGIVGPGTLAAMNVPVERRIHQIELNLERWRWMPQAFEPYYVMVNIPAFELKVVDGGKTVKSMRAIVGREKRPTPVLSSRITYFELNPFWHVPSKIAREDLLPKIQEDPQYLVRQNFQVFDSWEENAPALDPRSIDWASLSEDYFPFRLRQKPAPQNALGRVKFIFPNAFSVYIHDTPSRNLFIKASRDMSSGCVRVEKPLELASVLLNRQNWSRKRLTEALASSERQVVILKKPVPVYLVYLTAWAEEDGEVHFREDIYGRDRELQTIIAENLEMEQKCDATAYPTYFVRTGQGSGRSSAGI
jgi:murein L,D-transpeptidase YcbB/YkuD